jgi:hypothetical protein
MGPRQHEANRCEEGDAQCTRRRAATGPGTDTMPSPGYENLPLAKEILASELWWLRQFYDVCMLDYELGINQGLYPWPGQWALPGARPC